MTGLVHVEKPLYPFWDMFKNVPSNVSMKVVHVCVRVMACGSEGGLGSSMLSTLFVQTGSITEPGV